jgi:hypothetical protein
MIETVRIPYTYPTRPEETYRFDGYFIYIVVLMIGLPMLCMVPVLPIVFVCEWWTGERNLFLNLLLLLSAAGLGMVGGFWYLLKLRAEDYQLWKTWQEGRQQDAALGEAEQVTISHIYQYWPVESCEPQAGYLIHTREGEWFYLFDQQLDEFEEDTFPRSEVTLLRAPHTGTILEIQTAGEEVEFMGFVEDELIYNHSEDLHFGALEPTVCESLKSDGDNSER